jgi:hypothetical protein
MIYVHTRLRTPSADGYDITQSGADGLYFFQRTGGKCTGDEEHGGIRNERSTGGRPESNEQLVSGPRQRASGPPLTAPARIGCGRWHAVRGQPYVQQAQFDGIIEATGFEQGGTHDVTFINESFYRPRCSGRWIVYTYDCKCVGTSRPTPTTVQRGINLEYKSGKSTNRPEISHCITTKNS